MKKDRWCGNFLRGRCVVTESLSPSLADKHSYPETIERPEIITDAVRIVSILGFLDPDKLKGNGDIPREITVNWPDVVWYTYFTCLAGNCKNTQKKCDQYK